MLAVSLVLALSSRLKQPSDAIHTPYPMEFDRLYYKLNIKLEILFRKINEVRRSTGHISWKTRKTSYVIFSLNDGGRSSTLPLHVFCHQPNFCSLIRPL